MDYSLISESGRDYPASEEYYVRFQHRWVERALYRFIAMSALA